MLHNYVETTGKSVGQVSGDRKAIAGYGNWHVEFGGHVLCLYDVLCMPDNPTCTLSTGALKRDGFIYTAHDAMDSLHLINPVGINVEYKSKNLNFRTVNGLDYVPLPVDLPRLYDSDVDAAPRLDLHPDGEGYISNAVEGHGAVRRSARIAKHASPPLHTSTSPPLRKSNRTRQIPIKFRDAVSPPPPKPPQARNLLPQSSLPKQNGPPKVVTISSSIDSSHKSTSLASPYLTKQKQTSTNAVDSAIIPSLHMQSLLTHLKFGCKNMRSIMHMVKHESLTHMPTSVADLDHPCPICIRCKLPKLRRNPSQSTAHLKPGEMLQMDFSFFNKQSIRGFTSYLSCLCVATKYSFKFCTRYKRAPVDIIKWIIQTINNQGHQVKYVRFDEGGELARSHEINSMLVEEFQIIMQTTGGYASHLNGAVERGNRTDADTVRSMLYSAGLPDEFWCFALLYANYVHRRWCTYPETVTPYEKWTKTKPSFNKIHVFGATVYVHNELTKKLDDRATAGIFLGYGASTAVVYYCDATTKIIKRAHHVKVDNYQIGASNNTPGSQLIARHANIADVKLPASTSSLQHQVSPFNYDTLFTYDVTLPSQGPLGLTLENDSVFGLPVINAMTDTSPFKPGCKKNLQKNSWIIGIHYEEPVTKERFLDYVSYLRANDVLNIRVTLSKRIHSQATKYQMYRTYFDNFRPIAARATLIVPEAKYALQCPEKPITPKSWGDVIKGPYKDVWYKAVFERYDKNHQVGLLSIPVPKDQIPTDAIVLRAVSAFKIKTTNRPDIFDFYFRMCADGSKQIKGLHYDESHSPVPCTWTILTTICVAAALSLTGYIIDIDNAFQNTPRYPTNDTRPLFITCPPLYLPWFKQRFPQYRFNPNKQYVLQCYMNMQGMRTAGRDFHTLLTAVLEELNIRPTSVDKGIFVFLYKSSIVLLAISTDDILLFTKYEDIYVKINEQLQKAFGTTTQNGKILNYLNYRIVQSENIISVDQTDFILGIVHQYIPPHEKCPKIDTPLRTDKMFDIEIQTSVPASSHELKQLLIEYKVDFRTVFGQLCHIMKASRPDLANTINRLGVFQAGPNKLAYKCVFRVLQYLKTHPNVPLVYPKRLFNESTKLMVHSSSGELVDSLSIPHCLCGHVDISFAPHKEQRHSVGGHVETLNAVAIDWKTEKQLSCATSATDAETRQYYSAAKRIVRIRNFMRQIGILFPHASPISSSFKLNYTLPTPVFEDNKGTRDMIAAGRVTSNLKHVDIPLTYLHALHESGTLKTSAPPVLKTAAASSRTMLANFMTKQESGPNHIKSTKWVTGRQHYPSINSDHYAILTKSAPLSLL